MLIELNQKIQGREWDLLHLITATMQEVLEAETPRKNGESAYFDDSEWAGSSSREDFVEKYLNASCIIGEGNRFAPPVVVKPTKVLNKSRGVPRKDLYLQGKQDCFIGSSPALNKNVHFYINATVFSSASYELLEKFSSIVVDALQSLENAGYNPVINFLGTGGYIDGLGGVNNSVLNFYNLRIPNLSTDKAKFLVSNFSIYRYLLFKIEDCFINENDFGVSKKKLVREMYDNHKGKAVHITSKMLSLIGISSTNSVGSFAALSDEESVKDAEKQISLGMKNLNGAFNEWDIF